MFGVSALEARISAALKKWLAWRDANIDVGREKWAECGDTPEINARARRFRKQRQVK